MTKAFIHQTACVEEGVTLGDHVKIWNFVHVRKGAVLGDDVSVGKDSYIDAGVRIGKGSRIQNQVNVYAGVKISDYCFIGPAVVFTNDQFPRVGNKQWKVIETHLESGVSIGAGAIIRCGITIGAFAMIGAGALVTKSVPAFTLVIGHPAGETRKICACGQTVLPLKTRPDEFLRDCCKENMSPETYQLAKIEVSNLIMQV